MNIGYILSEEQLQRYFSQYGSVLDVYLPRWAFACAYADAIACAQLVYSLKAGLSVCRHKSGRNKGFGCAQLMLSCVVLDVETTLRLLWMLPAAFTLPAWLAHGEPGGQSDTMTCAGSPHLRVRRSSSASCRWRDPASSCTITLIASLCLMHAFARHGMIHTHCCMLASSVA